MFLSSSLLKKHFILAKKKYRTNDKLSMIFIKILSKMLIHSSITKCVDCAATKCEKCFNVIKKLIRLRHNQTWETFSKELPDNGLTDFLISWKGLGWVDRLPERPYPVKRESLLESAYWIYSSLVPVLE